MGVGTYRRALMGLSRPLQVAIGLGVLVFVTWVVGVTFQLDVLVPVLFLLFVGVVVAAGVELTRHETRWVRVVGMLMLIAAGVAVVLVALTVALLEALCGSGACD